MRRMTGAVLMIALGVGATGALGQSSDKVPIRSDLQRVERPDPRHDRDGAAPAARNVTPTNPSGVPGFDGPPGTVGDSVNSYGALPQGAAGSDIR